MIPSFTSFSVAGPPLRFWFWQRWGRMRPASASLFDPTPELIRHHAFLFEGAGRHYATRTKVRSRWNHCWTARCRERVGMYPPRYQLKAPPSRKEREKGGAPAHTLRLWHSRFPPFRKERERMGHPHYICDLELRFLRMAHPPRVQSRNRRQ